MRVLYLLFLLCVSESFGMLVTNVGSMRSTKVPQLRGGGASMSAIAIVVDAEIEPDRVDEFLKVMEADARGSRDEAGCLRFDVVRASETRFFFYEVYERCVCVCP